MDITQFMNKINEYNNLLKLQNKKIIEEDKEITINNEYVLYNYNNNKIIKFFRDFIMNFIICLNNNDELYLFICFSIFYNEQKYKKLLLFNNFLYKEIYNEQKYKKLLLFNNFLYKEIYNKEIILFNNIDFNKILNIIILLHNSYIKRE